MKNSILINNSANSRVWGSCHLETSRFSRWHGYLQFILINCIFIVVVYYSSQQIPANLTIHVLYCALLILVYWLPKPHYLWHNKAHLLWCASHDALCGIYNRHYLQQQLVIEWRRASRQQTPIAILMLDIDNFKQYNDTFGHLFGDRCLQLISQKIRQTIQRAGDLVARYGGEEFVVLLPNTTAAGAQHIATKLQQALTTLEITVSIGSSVMIPAIGFTHEQLLQQADLALLQAKQAGKACYRLYAGAILLSD